MKSGTKFIAVFSMIFLLCNAVASSYKKDLPEGRSYFKKEKLINNKNTRNKGNSEMDKSIKKAEKNEENSQKKNDSSGENGSTSDDRFVFIGTVIALVVFIFLFQELYSRLDDERY